MAIMLYPCYLLLPARRLCFHRC